MTARRHAQHVVTHVRDALAQDGRVGELGLEVRHRDRDGDEEIVVSGAVSTAERKRHVVAVATEVLRAQGLECTVRDDTTVTELLRSRDRAAETL